MARKMKTMDGNNAAAYASYAFTDVAAIYPITPSSNMAEVTDKWSEMFLDGLRKQLIRKYPIFFAVYLSRLRHFIDFSVDFSGM